MARLLNSDLRINVNTLTCSLEELQIQIEKENKEKAYSKFMASIEKSKEKNQFDSLPSYNNLLKKVYYEAQRFWDEQYTYNITTKAKKKALWNNLIKPVNEAYHNIIDKDSKAKSYTTEPRDLIPFLVAQEMVQPLFTTGYVRVITATNLICNRITTVYRMERAGRDEASPLYIGVLEFIRSIATDSTVIDTKDASDMEPTEVRLARGNYFVFAKEIAKSVIASYDEMVADTKNTFEPMIVKPVHHSSLHDKKGGYLTINSELNKYFYGANSSEKVFNSETNPDYFKVKNAIQDTAYSVNTNMLTFLESLHREDPELIDSLLCYNYKKEQKALEEISSKLSASLIELRKQEKELWKTYHKHKTIADKLAKRIKEQETPTEKQKKNKARLDAIITEALSSADTINQKIEELEKPIKDAQSRVSKAQSNRRTLDIAVKYQDFKEIFFPIFVGSNDRTYYYTSDFNPQGNNLCKSLISLAEAERMTDEGFESFLYCFGTLFDGMSKKVRPLRVKAVQDNHEAIIDFVERRCNRFLTLLDSDEIFTGIAFAIEYYNHLNDSEYKTKVITYVDAASSAVQIQGLTQKCEQCLTLTSVINPEGETLADAYMVTAEAMKKSAAEIISMSDADLMASIEALI